MNKVSTETGQAQMPFYPWMHEEEDESLAWLNSPAH